MDGQVFGHYRLERLIGSGGMGDVYEAVDLKRDRVVALKLLPELFSGNAEFQARFRRESQMAARLRDPHIIPIHDYGEIDRRLYIDMRLVDQGATIATLLRDEGPMTPARAVDLVGQVADALDAAHADGLIHRDVKPSNVLVTARDFVYVVDFGIAHRVGHTRSGLTMSGSTVGTLDYMAPERFTNKPVDRRADIYSLGCLLSQCLTAQPPFEGSDDLATLMFAHLSQDPPVPSTVNPAVPPALDQVVATAMAKAPEERYATAGALASAARRSLGGPTETAREPARATPPRPTRPDVPATPAPEEARRRRPVAAAVVALAGSSMAQRPESPSAPTPPALPARLPVPNGATTADAPAGPRSPRNQEPRTPSDRRTVLGIAATVVVLAVALALIIVAVGAPGSDAGRTGALVPVAEAPRVLASSATPAVEGAVATPPTPGYMETAPDGRFAYVSNRDPRVVTVLDLTTGRTTATIPLPAAPPRFITFNADGSRAYVSSYTEDNAVNLVSAIDTRTSTVVAMIPVDKRPYGMAVAPDQRTLWVSSHDTGSIDVVDTASNTITRRIPVAPNPHSVAFGGGRLYVANHESNLVSALDPRDGTLVATIGVGTSPHSVAVSPDGARVSVANYDADSVSVIDTATNRVSATVPVARKPQHVRYAPDGRHFYVSNVDSGAVSVVDTATDRVTATVAVGGSPTSVSTTPDGARAYVTCLDDARLTVLGTSG